MLKIILDTNIIVSLFIKRSETAKTVFDALKNNGFQLVISEAILKETLEVLSRPRIRQLTKMSKKEIRQLGLLLLENALKVKPQTKLAVCRDPFDDKFLECAVAAKADYLVSGDKDLLVLKSFRGTAIIRLAEFMEILANQ